MKTVIMELGRMVEAYARRVYPPFVYGPARGVEELPIFFYHDIRPTELEVHLQRLKSNGYRTLSCQEAVQAVEAGTRAADEAVVLSFDDGLAGMYSEVFPLLARYRMKAVAYIIPGWIGKPGFMTWEQVREMHESGCVDFQSHSYAHAQSVTRPRVRSVWRKRSRAQLPWGVPGIMPSGDLAELSILPVFEGRSLFASTQAFLLPGAFWDDCLKLGEAESGLPRAGRKVGRKEFNKLAERHASGTVETSNEALLRMMVEDLRKSREAIEGRLKDHLVQHFAFPWHEESAASWRALEMAGFKSGAVGLALRPSFFDSGLGILRLRRVNGDFLLCLPGSSRRSFSYVAGRKIARRIWRALKG